jgi:hypothetical protein
VAHLLQSLDRYHLDVARDAPSVAVVGTSTVARPTCYTGVLWCPLLRALTGASTTQAAGHDPYLVTLDGRVESTVIGQLLQYHDLDSPGGNLTSVHPSTSTDPHPSLLVTDQLSRSPQ